MLRLSLVLVMLSLPATAQPLGPDTLLRGFDAEQSRMVFDEGSRIFSDARRRFGKALEPLDARAIQCGLAQFMRGAIEAAAFHERARLTSAQLAGARRAIEHLQGIVSATCDRPPGGGLGTGNAGDRIAKAFFDAYAPRARSGLESLLDPETARRARDVALAATLIAAGLATLPLWI